MHVARTLHPIRIHLNDFVDQFDGQSAFPLRLANFLCISALVVDEMKHVEGHCAIAGRTAANNAERAGVEAGQVRVIDFIISIQFLEMTGSGDRLRLSSRKRSCFPIGQSRQDLSPFDQRKHEKREHRSFDFTFHLRVCRPTARQLSMEVERESDRGKPNCRSY